MNLPCVISMGPEVMILNWMHLPPPPHFRKAVGLEIDVVIKDAKKKRGECY